MEVNFSKLQGWELILNLDANGCEHVIVVERPKALKIIKKKLENTED